MAQIYISKPELLRKFYLIENNAFDAKVNFYEVHKNTIQNMGIDDAFFLQVEYLLSLFEISDYEKVLAEIDSAIEKAIIDNHRYHNGTDVYVLLLSKKTNALFHLEKYEEVILLVNQLVKIDKLKPEYKYLLTRSYLQKDLKQTQTLRGISVLCLFASMIIIVIELFYIQNFNAEYKTSFENLRNGLLILGFILMIINEGIIQFKRKQRIRSIGNK